MRKIRISFLPTSIYSAITLLLRTTNIKS